MDFSANVVNDGFIFRVKLCGQILDLDKLHT